MTVRSKRRSRAAVRELVRDLMETGLKPGQECPVSGQWANSARLDEQITEVKGKTFPPIKPRGARWVLVDATHHKGEA
jgi:ribosomal silencing factor RsfS